MVADAKGQGVDVHILGGRVLEGDGRIAERPLSIRGGRFVPFAGHDRSGAPMWDAIGLLLLPGIVDLHGDAFERQLMPRPGVHFPCAGALLETDRQMIANGITTAFHGLTYSWEPGLRGAEAARDFLHGLAAVRDRLRVDTRLHLRLETHNLEAEAEVLGWLNDGRIDLLAFNDHIGHIDHELQRPAKAAAYAGRSGLTPDAFRALFERVRAHGPQVPPFLERLAAAARAGGIPMASHDDETPDMRQWFSRLGSRICEFPVDAATARFALDEGDAVVLGAPNVLRGGSHCGRLSAADAVARGLCTVLTSDYYYPSLLAAAFRLATDGVTPLGEAWMLVSANPARAAGLADRGEIAPGRRADLIAVDDTDPANPFVIAAFVGGRLAYLIRDPDRLAAPALAAP